jgi:RimJ/RimL family protein N-acetyltransferase
VFGAKLGYSVVTRTEAAYLVERLSDPAAIRRILEPSPAYAAYALAQLEPSLFEHSEWWLAKGATGQALLLHARTSLGNSLFAMGDTTALEAVVAVHPGPRLTYITCQPEHVTMLQRHYLFVHAQRMVRMSLTAADFSPVGGAIRRMVGRDIRAINRLYASDGMPSYYADHHIDEGLYYGAFEGNRLVSIAGTHVISPSQGIAVVGNVFTHPRHRGKGYATVVTSAVTADLLQRCRQVVLTVDPENTPAVRAYRRLGYQEECLLVEGTANRRDLVGIGATLRRWSAARRGARYGGELVLRKGERRRGA